ncbi:hypothetical protein ACWEIJ_36120 [Lentzea sp. NPDC004789]
MTNVRSSDPSSDRRPPPSWMWCITQLGILTRIHSSAPVTIRFTMPSGVGPKKVNPPSAKNTRNAVISASDWPSWMPSTPKNARHHQRAIPSVYDKPWPARNSGAPASSTTVSATRTT